MYVCLLYESVADEMGARCCKGWKRRDGATTSVGVGELEGMSTSIGTDTTDEAKRAETEMLVTMATTAAGAGSVPPSHNARIEACESRLHRLFEDEMEGVEQTDEERQQAQMTRMGEVRPTFEAECDRCLRQCVSNQGIYVRCGPPVCKDAADAEVRHLMLLMHPAAWAGAYISPAAMSLPAIESVRALVQTCLVTGRALDESLLRSGFTTRLINPGAFEHALPMAADTSLVFPVFPHPAVVKTLEDIGKGARYSTGTDCKSEPIIIRVGMPQPKDVERDACTWVWFDKDDGVRRVRPRKAVRGLVARTLLRFYSQYYLLDVNPELPHISEVIEATAMHEWLHEPPSATENAFNGLHFYVYRNVNAFINAPVEFAVAEARRLFEADRLPAPAPAPEQELPPPAPPPPDPNRDTPRARQLRSLASMPTAELVDFSKYRILDRVDELGVTRYKVWLPLTQKTTLVTEQKLRAIDRTLSAKVDEFNSNNALL